MVAKRVMRSWSLGRDTGENSWNLLASMRLTLFLNGGPTTVGPEKFKTYCMNRVAVMEKVKHEETEEKQEKHDTMEDGVAKTKEKKSHWPSELSTLWRGYSRGGPTGGRHRGRQQRGSAPHSRRSTDGARSES